MNKLFSTLLKARPSLTHLPRRYFAPGQKSIQLDDPYTGEIIDEIPFTTLEDQQSLLLRSRQAYRNFRSTTVPDRIKLVKNIADYFRENKEQVATEITRTMGKPIVQSREEVDYAVERTEVLMGMAEEALRPEMVSKTSNISKSVIREPIGTVLILSSYDFPVISIVNHLVPAILCGNSCMLKDNPRAPLISKHFENALSGSDLALRLFASQENVKQLYTSHEINYVVFMGSLQSAHDVYTEVAQNDFIDVQLDLGGKDAAYVAGDCDVELTVQTLVKGAFYNTGQSRNSIQRIYVHKDISGDFINQFSKKAFDELKLGNPLLDTTNIGPMAILEHVEELQEVIEDAVSMQGLTILGGTPNTDEHGLGRFFEPTIIANANNGMRAQSDQFFGPLVTFQDVENDKQAIELINSSKYGIQSSVFTQCQDRVDLFSEKLRVGVVNVNQCPRMQDHYLPVTGRKVCQKILYNSRHAFDNFTKLKSLNIRLDGK
ncbi:hypothetical protein FGO68_gene16974 [Halteria grandinella]|uniref:Aldehyde dehydrogenase domain-containing protein n=1 Tax=Halteria grandinella TaxID=5974 RepID=A0A8J8T292_HALGN|nr:hypothetical protein FGO68_gene16974 [Halteria grandinella]